MDESLAVVRALLSGKPVDVAGEHFALAGARIEPAPRVPVPIAVGGRSEAAIRRAGRLGDGWFGIWVSPERYRVAIDLMQSTADDAGRGELTWTNALNVWCGVGRDAEAGQSHVATAMERLYRMPYDRFAKWSPERQQTSPRSSLPTPTPAANSSTSSPVASPSKPKSKRSLRSGGS